MSRGYKQLTVQRILELGQTMPPVLIAAEMNLDIASVKRYLIKHGIPILTMRKDPTKAWDKELARQRFAEGWNIARVASACRVNRSTIANFVEEEGIEWRSDRLPAKLKPVAEVEPVEIPPPCRDERPNPLAEAKRLLGTRLRETPTHWEVDGVPKTFYQIVDAVNRVKREIGEAVIELHER